MGYAPFGLSYQGLHRRKLPPHALQHSPGPDAPAGELVGVVRRHFAAPFDTDRELTCGKRYGDGVSDHGELQQDHGHWQPRTGSGDEVYRSGTPVTSFSIATNRVFTDPAGERQTETEWFTIIAWRQLAELCNQYLSKGRRAFVEGRLHSRTWEGNDGKLNFVNEINADRVLFLDRAEREAGSSEGWSTPDDMPPAGSGAPSEPDDLPF